MNAPPEADRDVRRADDLAVLVESRADPERFEALFDRYYPEIHRYARGRLGAAAADDVASETFLIGFRGRRDFDGGPSGGHVRAWLYGIATNLIRRHHRDEERRFNAMVRVPADPVDAGHDERVVVRLSAERIRGELAAALAELPARDRDVLLLMALGGLDHHEIAAALDIPYGTVCSRLNRVRRKVRAALGVDPTLPD
ncbi:RNA polymerase sigma factor [Phytohabitans rumicis]|uniref:DNA-directed RNA polymerase sigma-70 factor n=1 Tax=Phytohabitans rumicis TaxID=1076125 RepID=A0A6V8KZW6_9ACTN|nr:RNA polymerase sigma factor [Phytohabitans rumicis]GFJ88890.1 DNA-directed RNA polymerase sigma-70 factor [Phytohabitans rumicis]